MEEFFFKTVTEFGFPAIVSVILLTKGLGALEKLTESVNKLTSTVEKLSGVNARLDKLETTLEKFIFNRQ